MKDTTINYVRIDFEIQKPSDKNELLDFDKGILETDTGKK